MSIKFDIIDYLSGLTAYVFDVSVLRRVAMDNGVAEVREYNELDAEQIDRCKMSLQADAHGQDPWGYQGRAAYALRALWRG